MVDNRAGFAKLMQVETAKVSEKLAAKALGNSGGQKPLPVQRLDNVRPCLAAATLAVQVAMIANRIWDLPLRNISTMAAALT